MLVACCKMLTYQFQEACVKKMTTLLGECFGKVVFPKRLFYNSAPLQRYVENGSSQVVGCECALQKEISLTELLALSAQCVPA